MYLKTRLLEAYLPACSKVLPENSPGELLRLIEVGVVHVRPQSTDDDAACHGFIVRDCIFLWEKQHRASVCSFVLRNRSKWKGKSKRE
jgi:hypothetical protein